MITKQKWKQQVNMFKIFLKIIEIQTQAGIRLVFRTQHVSLKS